MPVWSMSAASGLHCPSHTLIGCPFRDHPTLTPVLYTLRVDTRKFTRRSWPHFNETRRGHTWVSFFPMNWQDGLLKFGRGSVSWSLSWHERGTLTLAQPTGEWTSQPSPWFGLKDIHLAVLFLKCWLNQSFPLELDWWFWNCADQTTIKSCVAVPMFLLATQWVDADLSACLWGLALGAMDGKDTQKRTVEIAGKQRHESSTQNKRQQEE